MELLSTLTVLAMLLGVGWMTEQCKPQFERNAIVLIYEGKTFKCMGMVIERLYVLTAFACVAGLKTDHLSYATVNISQPSVQIDSNNFRKTGVTFFDENKDDIDHCIIFKKYGIYDEYCNGNKLVSKARGMSFSDEVEKLYARAKTILNGGEIDPRLITELENILSELRGILKILQNFIALCNKEGYRGFWDVIEAVATYVPAPIVAVATKVASTVKKVYKEVKEGVIELFVWGKRKAECMAARVLEVVLKSIIFLLQTILDALKSGIIPLTDLSLTHEPKGLHNNGTTLKITENKNTTYKSKGVHNNATALSRSAAVNTDYNQYATTFIDIMKKTGTYLTSRYISYPPHVPYMSRHVLKYIDRDIKGKTVMVYAYTGAIWQFSYPSMNKTFWTAESDRPTTLTMLIGTVINGIECIPKPLKYPTFCLMITCMYGVKKYTHLIGSSVIYNEKPLGFISYLIGSCFSDGGLKALVAPVSKHIATMVEWMDFFKEKRNDEEI